MLLPACEERRIAPSPSATERASSSSAPLHRRHHCPWGSANHPIWSELRCVGMLAKREVAVGRH